MHRALQTIYGRLLMIPRVGPMFRIPVLTWRAAFGRSRGMGLAAAPRDDALALATAAIDGLRAEMMTLRAGHAARDAQLQALRDHAAALQHKQEQHAAELQAIRAQAEAAQARQDQQAAELHAMRTQAEQATEAQQATQAQQAAEFQAMRDRAEALQAMATQQAEELQQLRDRLEFARAELMFELRAQLAKSVMPTMPGATGAATAISPRILAPAKVEALRGAGALRVNLGCGHVPMEGYVNVDMRELPGVDAIADAADLPFAPGSIDEIHSAHLVEHFPLEHLRRVVLPHWHMMLRPGGVLRAVTPDAQAMLADFAAEQMSFEDLREVTYGLQEYDGDYHFCMFTPDSLGALLREAGFTQVGLTFTGRKNGKCRDMEIQGVKA